MNKEERIQYVLDSIEDNVAVNIALSLVEECDDLQQENERLKERVAYLERSNDRREDEIIYLRQELNDREEKINKAIEYDEYLMRVAKYHLNTGHLKNMRKILKGEENE